MATKENSSIQPLGTPVKRRLKVATEHFCEQLMQREAMVEALGEARGFTRDQIAGFRLGLVAEVDELPEFNNPLYKNRISIPYLDANGQPVQLRFWGRKPARPGEAFSKYLGMPGDKVRVFGAQNLCNGGEVREIDGEMVNMIHVAEGEFDAMSLMASGRRAIALPGASFPLNRLKHQLQGFSWIVLWADPDEAGRKLADRIRAEFPHNTITVALKRDVNDTFKEGGTAALDELEERALRTGGAYENPS